MAVVTETSITQSIISRDKNFVVQNYGRYPLAISHGEGAYLYDFDGRQYLDFISGIGVMALGHAHPRILEIIAEQASTLIHCSNLYYHPNQGALAEKLAKISRLSRTFFCNSGAEAVEAALKIAKGYGRAISESKYEIIALQDSFAGRTLGAISLTGQPKYREPFEPLIPGIKFIGINDTAALQDAVNENTAAIFFEPILGEGGIVEISAEFAAIARQLARQFDALLVCDEIQCGLGRTGKAFSHQFWGEEYIPDVITVAKPLAAGLPIGAVICNEKAAAVLGPGMHGSTFGGGALTCRVALEFIEMLPDLMSRVREIGAYFEARLQELIARHEFVKKTRGKGLMLGLELSVPGAVFINRAQEQGLLLNCTAGNILRFLPPYTIEHVHVDDAIGILDDVLSQGPEQPT